MLFSTRVSLSGDLNPCFDGLRVPAQGGSSIQLIVPAMGVRVCGEETLAAAQGLSNAWRRHTWESRSERSLGLRFEESERALAWSLQLFWGIFQHFGGAANAESVAGYIFCLWSGQAFGVIFGASKLGQTLSGFSGFLTRTS